MFETVKCLHEKNVIHGDLNSNNILFGKNYDRIFTIDFGGACDLTKVATIHFNSSQSTGCSIEKLATPLIFTHKSIREIDLNSDISQKNLKQLFKVKDLFSVLMVGFDMMAPTFINGLNNNEYLGWLNFDVKFMNPRIRECINEYENFTNEKIPAISIFIKKAFGAFTDSSNIKSLTADYFLQLLSTT